MQMSYLYASDFSFKNFCKVAHNAQAIRENCLGKERIHCFFFFFFFFFLIFFFFIINIFKKEKKREIKLLEDNIDK